MITIRQLNDPTLYKKSKSFNPDSVFDLVKIKEQISLLKQTTSQYPTSAGMAAVQCAEISEPYRVFILGNNHISNEYKQQLAARGIVMPREKIIINPEIAMRYGEPRSVDQQCFSVCGPLRGQLPFYKFIGVKYLTLDDNDNVVEVEEDLTNEIEGRIFQHEYLHVEGMTYLNLIINQLTFAQLETIIAIIKGIKGNPIDKPEPVNNLMTIFQWDANGIGFEALALEKALRHTQADSLNGFSQLVESALVAKQEKYNHNLFCLNPIGLKQASEWDAVVTVTSKDEFAGPGFGA
jgi:peptide deformylase